jgi:hypothetical protein
MNRAWLLGWFVTGLAAGGCGKNARPPDLARSDAAQGSARDDAAPASDAPSSMDPVPDAGVAEATGVDGAPAPQTASPAIAAVIPVLWLEVGKPIVDAAKVPGKLRIIEAHSGDPLANPTAFATLPATLETPMGIELRGQSSQDHAKQPFGIELLDAAGQEVQAPVLGMPKESDWVLYPSCHLDKSCLRNALVYHLYREMDPARYGVRWRFAEVFIDGDYRGLYMVVERIKRDKNRVNLREPAADASLGDITGGYIFRRERAREPERTFVTPGMVWPHPATGGSIYLFHYPRHDRITPAQKAYLLDYVARFEAMWNSPQWADPASGYRRWIDLGSWLDTAIVTELTMNPDGYRKSQYFYKQADADGGKLFSGPQWDFDLGLGIDEWGPNGWVFKDLCCLGRGEPPGGPNNAQLFYWHKLWGLPSYGAPDASFHNDLQCRWRQLRQAILTDAHITELVDGWARGLAAAQARDDGRWKVSGRTIGGLPVRASYQAELDFLKSWMSRRLVWMDENMPGTCPAAP